MNCPYCNAILNKVQTNANFNTELVLNLKVISSGECPYCKHYPSLHYVKIYHARGNFIKCEMDLTLFKDSAKDDTKFKIECYPNLDQVVISEFVPVYGGGTVLSIVSSLGACSITPKNAKDKLKLYLCML